MIEILHHIMLLKKIYIFELKKLKNFMNSKRSFQHFIKNMLK